MNNKIKFISFALILVATGLFSCKSKEKSGDKPTSANGNTKTLVVEFFSRGRGIDSESRALLDSMIAQKTELNCEFTNSILKHGREGERKYCFSFTDNRCFNKVYGTLDAKFGSKETIRIVPNGKCEK